MRQGDDAMAHTTIWKPDGIIWRFFGVVDTDEVNRANSEMYDDPRFLRINYFIWDMLDVVELVKDDVELSEPAATDYGASFTNETIRGALVAHVGPVYDSCQRYIEMSAELQNPWQLRLFTNKNLARDWVYS